MTTNPVQIPEKSPEVNPGSIRWHPSFPGRSFCYTRRMFKQARGHLAVSFGKKVAQTVARTPRKSSFSACHRPSFFFYFFHWPISLNAEEAIDVSSFPTTTHKCLKGINGISRWQKQLPRLTLNCLILEYIFLCLPYFAVETFASTNERTKHYIN